MVEKLRCQDCGRITEARKLDKYHLGTLECAECDGNMRIFGSKEDTYNPNNKDVEEDESDEEDEEETTICYECGREVGKGEYVYFEEEGFVLCKKCIDKVYPRKSETKIEYKDKVVEKPIIKYVDSKGKVVEPEFYFNEKSRFD